MSRIFAVLGVGLGLLASSAGIWGVTRPPTVPFLVAGATDIAFVALKSNEWQISYSAPDSWYAHVIYQLEQDGWRGPERAEYAPLSRTFTRVTSFGVIEAYEWVFVYLDPFTPEAAQIKLRRVVVFPWWGSVSRRVSESWSSRRLMILQPSQSTLHDPR